MIVQKHQEPTKSENGDKFQVDALTPRSIHA